MVYEDNPFNSPEGQMLLSQIFDLIYLTDPSDRNILEQNDLNKLVNHFRDGQPQVTTLMRQFFGGYQYYNAEKSFQTGILLCSNDDCARRDFVFNWEHVDFGVITGIEQWLGSVGLRSQDGYGAQRGYLVLCRVRCNRYTSCGECGFQVAGKWTTCKACKSSKKIHHGGCGTEHYTINYVLERSVDNLWPSTTGMIQPEQMVYAINKDGSSRMCKSDGTRPMYYRLVYKGPARDIMMDPQQVCRGYHIPMLEVGYTAENNKYQRPYGFECDECGYTRYAPYANTQEPWGKPMGGVTLNSPYDINDITKPSQSGTADGGIYTPLWGKPCAIDSCSGVLKPRMELPAKRDLPDALKSNFQAMQFVRTMNALPIAYPITPMKRSFTREIKVVSNKAGGPRNYWNRGDRTDDDYVALEAQDDGMLCLVCHKLNTRVSHAHSQSGIKRFIPGLKNVSCPSCGATDTIFVAKGRRLSHCPETGSMDVKAHPSGVLFKPKRYNFVPAPGKEFWKYQPTDAKNNLGGYGVYATYLTAPDDTEDYYNIRVDQAVLFSSRAIPDTIEEGQEAGQGITYCPNDQMAENTAGETLKTPGKGCCTLPDGTTRITTEYVCTAERGTYAGDNVPCPDPPIKDFPCSGVSSTNFSFLVSEGRSTHGWLTDDGWKDDSPECRSFRDPKTFKPLPLTVDTPITYPRWLSAPWYDTRVMNGTLAQNPSNVYKWCEPGAPHVMMDPWHTGGPVSATEPGEFQVPPMSTHRIKYLGLMQDPIGGSQMMWHCNTCESMCHIGNEREKKGIAKTFHEAWENGTYYPGVAALDYRVNRTNQYQAQFATSSPGAQWETFPALNKGAASRLLWIMPRDPDENPVVSIKERGGLNVEVEYEQKDTTGHGGGWWNWGTTSKHRNSMAASEDIVLF